MYRRGVCIYARGSNPPIHNRRNGEIGAKTMYVRDDNEQKGTKESKTTSEWHNYTRR